MTIGQPLFMQNLEYPAQEVRQLIDWDEGVKDLTALKVTQRGAGANFSVDVSAGVAYVKGDDQTDQGTYRVRVSAAENVAIGAAPGSNSRYDIVCLKINDPDATGAAGDNATIVVTAGTASGSPAVPTVPASSLLLAIVGPIASGTASITTSIIHDAQSGTGPTGVAAAHLQAGDPAPPGTPRDHHGPVGTIPNGWLLKDGSSLLRSAYPALFAVIGTLYGAADGTHFNLPDERGRVAVGLDNMGGSDAGRLAAANTLGGTGGTETVTLTAAQSGVPAHTHSITDPSHVHPPLDVGAGGAETFVQRGAGGSGETTSTTDAATELDYSSTTTGAASTGITATNANSTASAASAHDNMQPYLLVNKIIRT